MNNDNKQIGSGHSPFPKKEKTLLEIFRLIIKNKYVLLSSIIFFVVISLIYSFTAPQKYDAVATLKKERTPEEGRINGSDLTSLINLQSLDEIETEVQLVTTYSVLSKVVDELDLFCNVEGINWGGVKTYNINKLYLDIVDPSFKTKNLSKFSFPKTFIIILTDTSKSIEGNFLIRKEKQSKYLLINQATNQIISEAYGSQIENKSLSDSATIINMKDQTFILKTSRFSLIINWDDAPEMSEISFQLSDIPQTIAKVNKNTQVNREGKTDIFTVSYVSESSFSAAKIANTIVEKFRESRLAQKKENIRYSFDFVDKQLNEIQEKLKESENELSRFKASGQIMSIDASSQELSGFLSNLEAEKYNTDLQLSDYKNRAADLEKELKKNGYFDQSYLGPQGNVDGNSPFSQLMRQLSDLELQRLELLQKRTENHPDVIAIDEQIKLAKSRLAGFNENTITAYKIMINTLEKKLLKINDLMSKYEVKMRSLPSQENKLAQLLRQRGTYERIFQILLDQREAMRVAELSKMQDITIVDEARPSLKPFSPNKTLNLFISFILGILVGLIAIFAKELTMTRFVNLDDLENEFQVPILSIIPKYSKSIIKELNQSKSEFKVVSLLTNDSGLIETYRLFRTKLFQKLNDSGKVLMITSCEENSGKTSITANLAVSVSQEGKRVLLVDCDLRKADLSKMFGLTTKDPGLIDYLTKEMNPKIYSRASKNIDILPTGGLTDDSGTLLNSPKMKLLLNHLKSSNYDLIIFDTPPVTRVVDPLVMANYIKNVILVVKPKYSLIETVRWGMQELNHTNVKILGIVANAAEIENSYYYRYRYGYGYGYGNNSDLKNKTDDKTTRSKAVKKYFLSSKS